MDVRDLREKYEEIRRLRADPDAAGVRALAARFPGALPELERMPPDEVERRIEALDRGKREPWVEAQLVFHPALRGALIAKRWLGKTRVVDASVQDAFMRDVQDDDARAWGAELGALARPPRGRILDLVLARVATALGVTIDDARSSALGVAAAAARRR